MGASYNWSMVLYGSPKIRAAFQECSSDLLREVLEDAGALDMMPKNNGYLGEAARSIPPGCPFPIHGSSGRGDAMSSSAPAPVWPSDEAVSKATSTANLRPAPAALNPFAVADPLSGSSLANPNGEKDSREIEGDLGDQTPQITKPQSPGAALLSASLCFSPAEQQATPVLVSGAPVAISASGPASAPCAPGDGGLRAGRPVRALSSSAPWQSSSLASRPPANPFEGSRGNPFGAGARPQSAASPGLTRHLSSSALSPPAAGQATTHRVSTSARSPNGVVSGFDGPVDFKQAAAAKRRMADSSSREGYSRATAPVAAPYGWA